jgi:hypothetical protein
MSSVPQFKLNTGAEMPAIGILTIFEYTILLSHHYEIGLGGWAGLTAEERKNAAEWMTPALKVGILYFC